MTPPRLLLSFLLATGLASAGEYFRFDAPVGPGERAGTIHGYAFKDSEETVRVIDLTSLTAPKYRNSGEAFITAGAEAGCNGSFFHADGQPLGLIIADSRKTGTFSLETSLTSGTVLVRNGALQVTRSAKLTAENAGKADQLIQAGPFLVEDGKTVAELETLKYARRTVLLTSGKGDWAILYIPSATLDGLSKLLADGKSFSRFKVATALNLDGGTSSAFWVRRQDGATPIYLREAGPVRCALAILKR